MPRLVGPIMAPNLYVVETNQCKAKNLKNKRSLQPRYFLSLCIQLSYISNFFDLSSLGLCGDLSVAESEWHSRAAVRQGSVGAALTGCLCLFINTDGNGMQLEEVREEPGRVEDDTQSQTQPWIKPFTLLHPLPSHCLIISLHPTFPSLCPPSTCPCQLWGTDRATSEVGFSQEPEPLWGQGELDRQDDYLSRCPTGSV